MEDDTMPTVDELFSFVTKSIPDQAWQQAIGAHVRAKTGLQNLPAFIQNGATDEDKINLLVEIAEALEAGDINRLAGQIARGQAVPVNAPDRPVAPAPAPEPPLPTLQPPVCDNKPPAVVTQSEPDAVRMLREALEAIGVKGQAADPQQVEKLVATKLQAMQSAIDKRLDAINTEAQAAIQAAIAKAMEAVPPRAVIEIRENGKVREAKGLFHFQVTQGAAWIGADVPLWYWGEAGGGKTTMSRQLAEFHALKLYLVAMSEDITTGKMLGYKNLVNGEYVPGLFYEPYKNGGLLVLDEIDISAPAIACANAIIANTLFMFPNGEMVERHPMFRMVAFGNTKGTGAVAGYTARTRLDAATLDRFAIVKLEYDEVLEKAIVTGKTTDTSQLWHNGHKGGASEELVERWVDWVQRCRKIAAGSVLISPRASENGAKALRYGIPSTEAAEALVFKLVTPDTKTRLIQGAGEVPTE